MLDSVCPWIPNSFPVSIPFLRISTTVNPVFSVSIRAVTFCASRRTAKNSWEYADKDEAYIWHASANHSNVYFDVRPEASFKKIPFTRWSVYHGVQMSKLANLQVGLTVFAKVARAFRRRMLTIVTLYSSTSLWLCHGNRDHLQESDAKHQSNSKLFLISHLQLPNLRNWQS